ncbi:MAG: hypothetical protein OEZ39_08120 [Gammaproteobacteria bacterium]|nr:hypothetical protein [Gammaproteobacteria bacterium]MDH5651827.1 hypothetical protein [Gammaproteobacteria bacterium]
MSGSTEEIAITALGVISPVGANAEMTCACIRAGLMHITRHEHYECLPMETEQDEPLPLFASFVPTLEPYLDGPERLYQLCIPALSDLFNNGRFNQLDTNRGGLFLALPQLDDVVREWHLEADFISELCQRMGLPGFRASKIDQTGRAGVFSLIAEAGKLLTGGELDYCIVGGVDSWLVDQRLGLMDEAWRIKSDRNVDGFIPGEAAAMLLLETVDHARQRGIPVLSCIGAIGSGTEPETINSNTESSGEGLATAISTILEMQTENRSFDAVYCDLNGESYSAFEWGLMLSRLGDSFADIKQLIHPAENCGDIGAASGGLLLACASKAFEKGYNQGNAALLWTASDGGQRMALTLHSGHG